MRGNVKSKLVIKRFFFGVSIDLGSCINFHRQASDAGRSVSPTSDGGNASDDRTDFKGKTKAKGKKAGKISLPFLLSFSDSATQLLPFILADESDFTLKRKRVLRVISPWYTTGLIYIVSLNHPIFLPTRNQKRVRCPVCFQTYYGPFVLWSLSSFQGSPVARVKADPDSSGLPGNVGISISS